VNIKLTLLLGGMGLLLGALPASAQICGDLGDVGGETFDAYIDLLNEDFEVDLNDEDLCTSLTKIFIKGCQSAVKDAGKCIQNQTGNLSKFGQTACKELAGSFVSECVDDYKQEAKFGNELVKAAVEDESADCEEDLAFDFFDVCMFGF
jgi:hypothetical protein